LAVAPIDAKAFALEVERFYACLISFALTKQRVPQVPLLGPGIHAVESAFSQVQEPGLGGRLLYAGELDAEARALVVAANIAGAATLTASADALARKQAMREGVVDFLVSTLDEALRILKNELRKQETVAVCVAQEPQVVEREMRERGVLPDLLRPLQRDAPDENQSILTWRIASSPSLWLPKIDAIVLACLEENVDAPALDLEALESESTRRWLRLSPRYLGRMAQGVRVLRCDERRAKALLQRVREAVESGAIRATVEVQLTSKGLREQHTLRCSVN